MFSLNLVGFDCVDKTAALNDVLNKLGEGLSLIGLARRFVGDKSRVNVDAYDVVCAYAVNGLGTFENIETDVERVAIENSCKRLSDYY